MWDWLPTYPEFHFGPLFGPDPVGIPDFSFLRGGFKVGLTPGLLLGAFLLSLVSLVCGDSVYSGKSRGTCPLSTTVPYIDWKGFGEKNLSIFTGWLEDPSLLFIHVFLDIFSLSFGSTVTISS